MFLGVLRGKGPGTDEVGSGTSQWSKAAGGKTPGRQTCDPSPRPVSHCGTVRRILQSSCTFTAPCSQQVSLDKTYPVPHALRLQFDSTLYGKAGCNPLISQCVF